jgi:protein-disulfide isomerase
MKHKSILFIAGLLVVALFAGGLLMQYRQRQSALDADELAKGEEDGDEPELPSDVVVQLEEFCDYQSSVCAQLQPELKKLKEDFGANLNVVFRNLPLASIHKNALEAARAAESARMQGKFWEMHDLLYQNQHLWKDEQNPRPVFQKFARDLGLDAARFTAELDGEQVQFRIEADRDAAVRLGIDETPTIILNGRRLKTDATTGPGIREGIELMLAREEESP